MSSDMWLLNQIFAIILFYILFFRWLFFKFKNVILVKKLKCKDFYKNIKKDAKSTKIPKKLFKVFLSLTILFIIYLVIAAVLVLIIGIFSGIMVFIAPVFVDADPTFYKNFMNFVGKYFSLLKYITYYLYLIVYIWLVRAIYINNLTHKELSNKPTPIEKANEKQDDANKYNKRNNIILLIMGIIVIIAITTLIVFGTSKNPLFNNKISSSSIDLEDVVQPSMNIGGVITPSWYVFHNDKLFVYDDHGDQLYSTNLLGSNKKVLASSDNLKYANMFMVYNNEMYYYTESNRGIKKINLDNGEIKNVIDNKYFYLIPDTLNDNKVLVNYLNDYSGKSHGYLATLDLQTGLLQNERKLNFSSHYYYDINNDNVYYISDDKIYVNNTEIYSFKDTMYNINDFVFVQDNYIFAIIDNKIIKIDPKQHSIIEEKELDKSMKSFWLLSSVRDGGARTVGIEETQASVSMYPLFINNKNVYTFNATTLSFEVIIENINGGFVQKYDNYYIIQNDTQTIIYNTDIKEYKIYDSANYSVEGKYIYLMTYTGDFYHQKYDNLEFKIQKYIIDDLF